MWKYYPRAIRRAPQAESGGSSWMQVGLATPGVGSRGLWRAPCTSCAGCVDGGTRVEEPRWFWGDKHCDLGQETSLFAMETSISVASRKSRAVCWPPGDGEREAARCWRGDPGKPQRQGLSKRLSLPFLR